MRADEIMSIDVVTVSPETHIRDVARKLLERGVSALPVVDDGGRILHQLFGHFGLDRLGLRRIAAAGGQRQHEQGKRGPAHAQASGVQAS